VAATGTDKNTSAHGKPSKDPTTNFVLMRAAVTWGVSHGGHLLCSVRGVPPMTPSIEPGIYFDLPAAVYHADRALGSTDIRRLRRSAADYWHHSALNPSRPSMEPTTTQAFGHAIHLRVLEGPDKFLARYERAPDPEGLLVTDADVGDWLTAHGVNKLPRSKAEKIVQAIGIDPQVRILAEFERRAAEAGREILRRQDFDRIVIASDLITQNPHLASAFSNGHPEVSIFWDRPDGVRCKARFDFLKIRGIGDLKSTRNPLGVDFRDACRRAITNYRYDIQAAHYLEGRSQIPELLDNVQGYHDSDWLTQVAKAEEFGFVFVFFQADDAPISWACSLSPGNPVLEIGRMSIERAIERYKDFAQRFAPDEPWTLSEPVEELTIDQLPGYYGRDE
jgi:hypothetical protein